MLSVLIIEDELPNAARLEKMLNIVDKDVEIAGYLQTVQDSVIWLKSNPHPDLICMDIKLTDGLSFEIFNQVEIRSQVIFITAYDEYALRAFQVNGIDYLLKPVQASKLENSIRKVKTVLGATDNSVLLETLKKIHFRENVYRSRFLVSYRDMYVMIAVTEIAYFNSENKITFLTTQDSKRYALEETLEELEQELNPNDFFRVTRQFIISVKSITKIHQSFNGKLKLDLTPATAEGILVSREKSAGLKRWLNHSS
jgi:two-component system response regulator LytT